MIAFIGVLPPGLLNVTAAKISLKEGHNRGFMFSIGVCIIVALQVYIATVFAKYLNQHPEVTIILKRVAFVIFLLVSIYFFLTAKSKPKSLEVEPSIKSKQSRIFQGIFLSSLNIFPIPFQAYMVTTLVSFKWFSLESTTIGTYVSGAVMGSFIALYVYILFFDTLKNTKFVTPKNMNYSIAFITLAVAIVTLINLLRVD
ncbi:MAG: LysE family transporter [Bacteroidetes bacterium]|nr:LysE family transporter [Bacteroidota bacterium]MDA0860041.1 LysE family transporter [Bacteroidota bacterium]